MNGGGTCVEGSSMVTLTTVCLWRGMESPLFVSQLLKSELNGTCEWQASAAVAP